MASPVATTVMIECPRCGTRYQLPEGTIGPGGRKVACAHCGEAWTAKPLPVPAAEPGDALFDEEAEADLDAAFAAAEAETIAAEDPNREARERTLAEIKAALAPRPGTTAAEAAAPARPEKPDKGLRKLQGDFLRRQAAINRRLPLAKVRRAARIGGLAALVLLIVAGIVFRTEIVRRVPDLAGLYEAVGLGVNVVGLEFRDVTTIVTLREGSRSLRVDARIFSVAPRRVAVPRVLVTLLDAAGHSLYEWSVPPEIGELEPGEVVDFTAQLTSPPAGAQSVRLTFMDGRPQVEAPPAALNASE